MTVIRQLLIACPFVFFAGFVDSIAGGGGMISLPAYHMAGLPPHLALGTNKMSASVGTLFSAAVYARGGFLYKRIIPLSVAGALLGSWAGANCALLIDEQILRWVIVVFVPLLIAVTFVKKDLFSPAERDMPTAREQVITAAVALVIGWYDGFFGPGTGMFLILAFVGLLRLAPVTANGNAKVVNLCSNIAALAAFIASGKVLFKLALPCAAFSVLGNLAGSKLAVKNGKKIIRPVMLTAVILLLATVTRDLILNY